MFKHKKGMKTSADGFSMTELIFVVMIAGIIAAFAIPAYQKTMDDNEQKKQRVENLTSYAENQIYKAQTGEFPDGAVYTELDETMNDVADGQTDPQE